MVVLELLELVDVLEGFLVTRAGRLEHAFEFLALNGVAAVDGEGGSKIRRKSVGPMKYLNIFQHFLYL